MSSSSMPHFLAALICFVLFGVPILAIFFWYLIGWIVRYFVGSYLSRKLGHSIEFLDPLSTYQALNHGKYGPWCQYYHILKGTADFQRVKKKIENNLVFAKNGDGSLRNSNLHRRLAKSLSYFYWLPIKKLNIDDHVLLHRGPKPKTHDELIAAFQTTRGTETLETDRFWYMTYVALDDQFEGLAGGPHFAILSDIHHCIADGVSWTTIYRNALLEVEESSAPETKSNRKKVKNPKPMDEMWETLRRIFYAPICVVNFVWKARDSHQLLASAPIGNQLVKTSLTPLSVDRLRKIRNATKLPVTVNDLLTSCAVISVRRYFEKHGGDEQIPKYLTVAIPISDHGVSSTVELSNGSGVVLAYIPLTEETALGCLESSGKCISEAKNSVELWIVKCFCIYNYMPAIFEKSYSLSLRPTFVISNIPLLPSTGKYFVGENEHVRFGLIPHVRGNTTMAITVGVESGSLYITIGIDSSVASEKDVEDILNGLVEAINELETVSGLKKND